MELGDIIRSHNPSYHMYADDTQLYLNFRPNQPGDSLASIHRMQHCISHIKSWTKQHFLKINDDKSEVIIFQSKFSEPINIENMQIGDHLISTSPAVRNLGVIMDNELSGAKQIDNVTKGAFLQIRKLGQIRKFLSTEASTSVVHAYITSRLDYCNALYIGLPNNQIERLQRIQNTAARIVSKCPKYDHISPVLHRLHWLPVKFRIIYKVLLLTFKALNGLAPSYLRNCIEVHTPKRDLRSSNNMKLTVPRTKQKTYGDRSFTKAAPLMWNALSPAMRKCKDLSEFKRLLKTKLFKDAFNT